MINLYYHGGSANHGCEAIVRSTRKIIGEPLRLHTTNAEADRNYGLDRLVELAEDTCRMPGRYSWGYLHAAISHRLTHTDYQIIKCAHRDFFSQVKKGSVYLSIGGDNYCYAGRDILGYYNRIIHEKGGRTVLWGCSFEPGDLTGEIARDLARYDQIIARESISYEALHGVNPNTVLLPDPAFQLDREDLALPEGFLPGNTVGVNVSPLIMHCEANEGITARNYRCLVRDILEHTQMNVALIPHVVEPGNDDREPLNALLEEFGSTGRVVLVPDCNASQLKGYIARCRFFVGARTHATIAAYSTCVPTLVVGYSVKARGIARDIFGTEEHYVLPVQALQQEQDLVEAFHWLQAHEQETKAHLQAFIPGYCARVLEAGALVRGLEEA